MPTVRVLPQGSSGGFPGPGREPDDEGKTRGEITGWTVGMVRRQIAWLWSVVPGELSSDGWAVTLTTGCTPDSAADWTRARKLLLQRMIRAGVHRHHWVTEWTGKGRPHMHLSMYGGTQDDFRPTMLDSIALIAWLDICDQMGWPATPEAQHITPITGVTGWLEYVSKHASRGVLHYQRQGAPDGWEKTGKLWGHGGDWPTETPVEIELIDRQFYRYRRLVMRYQQTRMRAAGTTRKRRMSRAQRRKHLDMGKYLGMSGWIPEDLSLKLLNIAPVGHEDLGHYEWESASYVSSNKCDCGGRGCAHLHPRSNS